jgi:hypothetical protein
MNEPAPLGLTRLAQVKLIVALLGIAVFGYGIRIDSEVVRWIGIGLVALAWVMRFVRRKAPAQLPDETR